MHVVPFLDIRVMLQSDPSSSRLLDNSELRYQINSTSSWFSSSWLQDYECTDFKYRLDNAQHYKTHHYI